MTDRRDLRPGKLALNTLIHTFDPETTIFGHFSHSFAKRTVVHDPLAVHPGDVARTGMSSPAQWPTIYWLRLRPPNLAIHT